MNNRDEATAVKIVLNEDAYTEFQCMAIRKKVNVRLLLADILHKYADKHKEQALSK